MESEWLRTITHASVLSPTESKIWGKKVSVRRAWCTKSQSSLMKHLRILTSISVGSSPRSCSFASTAGLRPEYRSTAAKSGRNLSGMWRSAFKLGATHLRPMTEIALKSTYLCGNISPIQYDIRVGVRAIRMNIAFDYSAVECFDWKRCVFQIKKKDFSARGLMARGYAKLARIPREMNEPIGRRYLCYAQHNLHWWRETISARSHNYKPYVSTCAEIFSSLWVKTRRNQYENWSGELVKSLEGTFWRIVWFIR